jgi:hypothetical protein
MRMTWADPGQSMPSAGAPARQPRADQREDGDARRAADGVDHRLPPEDGVNVNGTIASDGG